MVPFVMVFRFASQHRSGYSSFLFTLKGSNGRVRQVGSYAYEVSKCVGKI